MAISRPLLREARRAASLTQQQMAEQLNVTQTNIARWETGAVEPGAWTARRLATALNTTMDAIWPENEKRARAARRPSP